MHGRLNHGDIAKRQGLGGLIPTGSNPFNPFGIFGDTTASTSSTSSSSSSSSSSSVSVSNSLVPLLTSSVTSSTSSTSPSPSPTLLSTLSTPAPTPTPTPTPSSSSSVSTSNSGGNVISTTATAPASASASASAAAAVSKSFLQNKPLAASVLTIVGIIGLAILIMIGTMWIRSSSRRRLDREALDASTFDPSAIVRDEKEKISSLEKLRRVNSTGSSGYSHNNTAGHASVGRGGYPAPPAALFAPQSYRQSSTFYGQPLEAGGYDGRYPSYLPPRSDVIYNSARTLPPPQVNIIAPTPSTGSNFYGYQTGPIRLPSQNMPAVPQHASLLNSPPASPGGLGEDTTGSAKGPGKTLNAHDMPVAPPLPPKFGSDENDDEYGDAYGGLGSDHGHEIPRSLKVANQ